MNTKIIVGVVALVLIITLAAMGGKKDESMPKNDMMDKKEEAPMVKDAMGEGDKMMEHDMQNGEKMMKDDKMMKGSYESYAPEKVMLAKEGDVVLFFHASWCPSCRSLNSNLEESMSAIPEGVTILKVDYDQSADLKKKYGVTSQHTLVQVDMDGNLIKKWSGGSTLQSVLSQIQ